VFLLIKILLWLTSVIPEVEIRRIVVLGQPQPKGSKIVRSILIKFKPQTHKRETEREEKEKRRHYPQEERKLSCLQITAKH
jgi:hypothetical protein